MKSIVGVVLIISIFISTSSAAVAAGFFNNPKYPGKCAIKESLVLSPGDIVKDPDTACGRIICGANGFAEFHTCGVELVHGCKMGGYINKSLPYPECCKRRVICD